MEPGHDPQPTSQELPERIGRYPVNGVLGKGAMGIVYRGTDPVIRRPVAIKAIRKELLFDSEQAESILARFRNEVQAAGSLVHPGIVSVYEYGEDGGLAYIVMECVEGNSLRQYIEQTVRFAVADAVSIAAQLLDALHFAHERGVWHRDVKPSNLKITADGRLKVLDFGIARIESSNLTQVGMLLGTHGFISPEQYLGGHVDHRADVFAAGVILYQLLAGVMPFRGSREAVMYKVCHTTPDPPSKASGRTEIEAFDPVVAKALATDPAQRFVSCAGFRDALLEAYDAPVNATVSEAAIILQQLPPLQRAHTSQAAALRAATLGGSTTPSAHPSSTPSSSPATRPSLGGSFADGPRLRASSIGSFDRVEPAPLPSELISPRASQAGAAEAARLAAIQEHLARMTPRRPADASDSAFHLTEVQRNLDRLIEARTAPPVGTETIRISEIERVLASMISPPAPGTSLPAPEPAPLETPRAGSVPAPAAPAAAAMAADADETVLGAPPPMPVRPRPAQVPPAEPVPSPSPPRPSAGPSSSMTAAPAQTVSTTNRLDVLTEHDQQRAIQLLLHYLGPVARIVVARAARTTSQRSAFLKQVSDHLSNPIERERFLDEIERGPPRAR